MASKSTTLSAINRGGIATLADGTCWHISSSELLKAKDWRLGAEVVIQSHKLINIETGVRNLMSCPSRSPPGAEPALNDPKHGKNTR